MSSLNPKLVNTRRREPELFVHFPRKSGSELRQAAQPRVIILRFKCVWDRLDHGPLPQKIERTRNFDWIDQRRGSLKTF